IGAGTVQLNGTSATLTDSNGATLTTGTITGFGQFAAAVTGSTNQAGHITANGGTLEVTGAITSGGTNALVLTATASTDTLKLDASGSAVKTATLNGGTLLLKGNRASPTLRSSDLIGAGTVQLNGTSATLTDSNGATL